MLIFQNIIDTVERYFSNFYSFYYSSRLEEHINNKITRVSSSLYLEYLDVDILEQLEEISYFGENKNSWFFFFIGLCLLVACIGKSAQVGLHLWLPEAMEGPTPVSSLIHAATMVTAGIFLLIKTSFIFNFHTLSLLMIVGGITAFIASSIGVFQSDMKKIVAYSTCSQLGYMLLACGLGGFNNSFFHLYTHAFFKALLFLTAGYVIHTVTDDQDMRKMGSLISYLPLCYLMILYGSILLIGFPMSSGFFSKEAIILLFKQYYFSNELENVTFYYNLFLFFEWFIYVSLIFTVWYSVKLILLVFYYKNNHSRNYLLSNFTFQPNSKLLFVNFLDRLKKIKKKKSFIKLNYSTFTMWYSIYELGDLSVYQGYICKDMFIGTDSDFFQNFLPYFQYTEFYYKNLFLFPANFNEYGIENVLYISTYMLFLFLFIYLFVLKQIYFFSVSPYFFFLLRRHLTEQYISYFKLIINPLLKWGLVFSYKFSVLVIEKGLVEWSGPFLIVNIISNLSSYLFKKTPHYVTLYIGLVFIVSILLFLLILL